MAEADWKYLQYNVETGQKRTGDGPSGGSSTFAGLDDVSFDNLQNGQVPKYNSETGKWENADESGGGGTVTDVTVDGVSVVNQQGVAEIEMPTPPSVPGELSDLSDVQFSNLADHQPLRYNSISQKWENGADNYPPLIYSDEEREVGVWRDGKPLYQKTITILPSALHPADNDLPISLPNMETFVRGFGTLKRSDGWGVAIPNSYGSTDWNIGIFNVRENMFDFWIGSSALRIASVVYITFQYTKTTDTAGSGTWTTQGALAHHYSTDEHIVGTWIDGKPLYEKTYHFVETSEQTSKSYSISNLNAEVVLLEKSRIKFGANGGYGWQVVPSWYENNQYNMCIGMNTANINITVNGWKFLESVITIQYTKTTD